ncbi:MAG: hypothetical protein K2R98_06780 [Gemmataceae bacterium]|nr:hypothetical protein [Gemmataceae bacterium]
MTDYQKQLTHWAGALAAGRVEAMADALAGGTTENVGWYLANAVGERYRLLTQELEFVALAFDDFDSRIAAYLTSVPRTAYRIDRRDQEDFLRWLGETQELTPQQRGFIAYQEAEYAVRAAARDNREAHLSFQRLLCHTVERTANRSVRVHLNSIRVWATLTMPGTDEPCEMLFVAVGHTVRAAALTDEMRRLVNRLASHGPGVLDALTDGHRELMAQGVVALESND